MFTLIRVRVLHKEWMLEGTMQGLWTVQNKWTRMKHTDKCKHCKYNVTGLKKAHAGTDVDVDAVADQSEHTVRRLIAGSYFLWYYSANCLGVMDKFSTYGMKKIVKSNNYHFVSYKYAVTWAQLYCKYSERLLLFFSGQLPTPLTEH